MRYPPGLGDQCKLTRCGVLLTAAMVLVSIRAADAQVAIDVVHGFPSPGAVQPEAPLTRASDGKFYGTTQYGGAHNAGTVFSLAPDGTFTVLHEFDEVNGAWPNALIQAGDGYLYGTTTAGGLGRNPDIFQSGFGTIFRISLDGTFTVLHLFSGADGTSPSPLIEGTDGLFYGTTPHGTGPIVSGSVFRVTPGGTVTTLYAFTGGPDGGGPSSLVQDSDGSFYGMTSSGGFGSGCGTIFRITAAGAFQQIHRFGAPLSSCHPLDFPQGMILVSDGLIMGATTLFVFAISDGTYIPLITGIFPDLVFGPLTLGADGNLYTAKLDAAVKIGEGGPILLHTFASAEGSNLKALIQAPDGNLYGTAHGGGTFGLGTVFRMTTSGDVTVLHDFDAGSQGAKPVASVMQASDGLLYGTNQLGGRFNGGTVFRVSTAGDTAVVHAFEQVDGITATSPTTPVIQASSGDFYGTTPSGAFRVTPDGAATRFTFVFPGSQGRQTAASLVQANDGLFYGTNNVSSLFGGNGAAFSMTSDGQFNSLHAFSGADGKTPAAELIQAVDGLLYGSTKLGGASGLGSIFSMSLDGELTSLYSFAGGADGASPVAPLVQAEDGDLYGTTPQGGGAGTVFKISPSGAYTQLHSFTGGAGGAAPTGKLVQAGDGNLYGTTVDGGAFGLGTIFRMTPAGGFLVVHSFTGEDGAHPHAGLIQATDGHLYGTTQFGGPESDGGVVYRVTLPPCTDTLMLTYGGGTLNMGFSLASSTPATFSTWLVHQTGVFNLWSVPVPAIAPAVSFNLPLAFPSIGNVGVLTVLNAPAWPAACYDFQIVDTGGAGASAGVLRDQIVRHGLIPKAVR